MNKKRTTMKQIPFPYVVLILCLQATYSESMTENAMAQEYLEKLEQSGYNPQIMPEPADGDGEPIYVRCELHFIDFYKVDEINMELQAFIYFRQFWEDPRLAHSYQDVKHIILNDVNYIWTPDLFFVQEKKGFLHNLITPNLVIGIHQNGTVEFTERLTMSFSCPMDFSKFPHDTQKCTIAVESFGYYRSKLEISWHGTVATNENISLPFRIENLIEGTRNTNYSNGEYTSLEVELTFQRKVGFFLTRLYVPFVFLTFLSWLSFWIPAKLTAHRLALLLLIMYLMVNIGNDINTQSPKTSYTKGIDVWITVYQSLVFATFLECIVAHMVETNTVDSQKKLCMNDSATECVLDSDAKINPVSSEPSINMIENRLERDVLLSDRIDKVSSVLFPFLFAGFNFIYWMLYCTGH